MHWRMLMTPNILQLLFRQPSFRLLLVVMLVRLVWPRFSPLGRLARGTAALLSRRRRSLLDVQAPDGILALLTQPHGAGEAVSLRVLEQSVA